MKNPFTIFSPFNVFSPLQSTIEDKPQAHHEMLKLSDFTLYKEKQGGINHGGFYEDVNHSKWLVKEGHFSEPEAVVKEYLAGALYNLFLGKNSPQTEMIINNLDGSLLTGSKLLDNFKTLSDCVGGLFNVWNDPAPYGEAFPHTFNGKPVEGFMNAVAAINFICDMDAHWENVGLIDNGDCYSFAKIDHGCTFHFSQHHENSLDGFREHLDWFYKSTLEKVGFEAVYEAVTNISNMDFSIIETLIANKMEYVKTYMEALDLKAINAAFTHNPGGSLSDDLARYENNLVLNLKNQHHDYQKIADCMGLEKAIISHDWQGLKSGFSKGLDLTTSFKPFYNAEFINIWSKTETKSVNGGQLIDKHWPELAELLKPGKNGEKPLAIQDILALDNPLDALLGQNHTLPQSHQSELHHFIPMHNGMTHFQPEMCAHVELA
jgi:hypothetical protein